MKFAGCEISISSNIYHTEWAPVSGRETRAWIHGQRIPGDPIWKWFSGVLFTHNLEENLGTDPHLVLSADNNYAIQESGFWRHWRIVWIEWVMHSTVTSHERHVVPNQRHFVSLVNILFRQRQHESSVFGPFTATRFMTKSVAQPSLSKIWW